MTHQDYYRSEFTGKKRGLALSLLLAGLCPIAPLSAAVFNVTDEAGLSAAITTSNSNGEDDTINIAAGTITLTADLPQIVDDSGFSLSIIGAGQTTTILEAGDLPQELGGTGTHNRRVLYLGANSNVTLSDMTIRRGRIVDSFARGGNILNIGNLSISECTISHGVTIGTSSRSEGAGIYSGRFISVTDSTIENNYTTGSSGFVSGAGINFGNPSSPTGLIASFVNSTISGNILELDGTASSFGGGGLGISVNGSTSEISIQECTIANNIARDVSVGGTLDTYGGGAQISSDGIVTVRNSTFSGNQAEFGGGVYDGLYSSGSLGNTNFEGCTITDNTALDSAGGIFSTNVQFRNSIIAGNTAPSFPDIEDDDLTNLLGFNLVGDGSSQTFENSEVTDMIGVFGSTIDPLLDVLADNGGPTLTHALMSGSPAIDMGTDQAITTATITVDQRGFPRVSGSQADIGAYELAIAPDTTPPVLNITFDEGQIGPNFEFDFSIDDIDATTTFTIESVRGANTPQVSIQNSVLSGTITVPFANDDEFRIAYESMDLAGNSVMDDTQAIPYNSVANTDFSYDSDAPFSGYVADILFPMESDLDLLFDVTDVLTTGTVTASRTITDAAPTGLSDSGNFIDEFYTFSLQNGLTITSGTLTFQYDEANLDGLSEGDLAKVYQDSSGSLTELTPAVDIINNTITVEGITTFSDFYPGNPVAETSDWNILEK